MTFLGQIEHLGRPGLLFFAGFSYTNPTPQRWISLVGVHRVKLAAPLLYQGVKSIYRSHRSAHDAG